MPRRWCLWVMSWRWSPGRVMPWGWCPGVNVPGIMSTGYCPVGDVLEWCPEDNVQGVMPRGWWPEVIPGGNVMWVMSCHRSLHDHGLHTAYFCHEMPTYHLWTFTVGTFVVPVEIRLRKLNYFLWSYEVPDVFFIDYATSCSVTGTFDTCQCFIMY